MGKKLSLKEKLEKLSLDGSEGEGQGPILKTKKVRDIKAPEADKTVPAPEEEIAPPEEEPAAPQPEPTVSEIEPEPDVKQPETKAGEIEKPKIEPKSIRNFEIPTDEIKGILGMAAVLDVSEKEHLGQILHLEDAPETELKWTVMRDPYAEEFAMIIKEGLKQFKTQPLILGMEVDDGIVLASHREGYTMTLGCYHLRMGKVIQIFVSLLEHIRKRMEATQ